jgi:UDP-N-acetylglucosamine 1-carboxyvinyltransferase
MPGGCAIGVRPIDQHLKGLEALGATFTLQDGYIHGKADGLKGAEIQLDVPTVTGTENILMAATLAEGTTVLHNAAKEPEIVDLATYLRSLGALIDGDGTSTITIKGVSRLTPASRPYSIMPDRIETGTYLVAAAATGGDITIVDTNPQIVKSEIEMLRSVGCEITTTETTIRCRREQPLLPFDLETAPFPGFPTDMQAQFMTLACLANGKSNIVETIFENRFMHASELVRMGAKIEARGNHAEIEGTRALKGAQVMASDLRASAALVIAGLCATGLTQVLRIYHLDRGYENLVGKLRSVGARIARVSDAEQNLSAMQQAIRT